MQSGLLSGSFSERRAVQRRANPGALPTGCLGSNLIKLRGFDNRNFHRRMIDQKFLDFDPEVLRLRRSQPLTIRFAQAGVRSSRQPAAPWRLQ
jgi:hypothetical protein